MKNIISKFNSELHFWTSRYFKLCYECHFVRTCRVMFLLSECLTLEQWRALYFNDLKLKNRKWHVVLISVIGRNSGRRIPVIYHCCSDALLNNVVDVSLQFKFVGRNPIPLRGGYFSFNFNLKLISFSRFQYSSQE